MADIIKEDSPALEDGTTSPVPSRSGTYAGVKRKRAAALAPSRTVANLTPEQLDKKRRNDREV
jgi:hypothetical protein